MASYSFLISFRAKPGKANDLAAALLAGSRAMQAEPGCLLHLVLHATNDETLWVVEAWNSEAAHDAAIATTSAQDLTASVMDLATGVDQQIPTTFLGGIAGTCRIKPGE